MISERNNEKSQSLLRRRRFLALTIGLGAAFAIKPDRVFAQGLDDEAFFQMYLEAVLVEGSSLPFVMGKFNVPTDIPRLNAFGGAKSPHRLALPSSAEMTEQIENPLYVTGMPNGPHFVYDSIEVFGEMVAIPLDADSVSRIILANQDMQKFQNKQNDVVPTRMRIARKVRLHEPLIDDEVSRIYCHLPNLNLTPAAYSIVPELSGKIRINSD